MVDALTAAKELRKLGTIRVLDLDQASKIRQVSFSTQDGIFYLLPSEGMSGAELAELLNRFRSEDALHFNVQAQHSMDTEHLPILSVDPWASAHFTHPLSGIVKVTAITRCKADELNAIIDEFKRPFDSREFPFIDQLQMTEFKPLAPTHHASLSLMPISSDWRHLRELEESLKNYMADANWIREIHVNRHSVQGMRHEIILTSTDETTERGIAFLDRLAAYLEAHRLSDEEMEKLLAEEPAPAFTIVDLDLPQFQSDTKLEGGRAGNELGQVKPVRLVGWNQASWS